MLDIIFEISSKAFNCDCNNFTKETANAQHLMKTYNILPAIGDYIQCDCGEGFIIDCRQFNFTDKDENDEVVFWLKDN